MSIICGGAQIDNAGLQVNSFSDGTLSNIWDENNTKSEIQYSIIGRIMYPGFRMSRGLSVNPISVQVIMYICV